ncbi:HTH-type transcriptional repressor NemR [Vibrio palustris]|uniref:HTH-type transcriptional repressor NemR n=2 Tax=Vibrio palustris TaxID=1918946 RepID=A0A1R4B603_9VIBR|nr:HTH-type transcriptional repressor NemR [Vibrio palustris]
MKSLDTKQHILDVGYQIVAKKGFTGMGLSELLKAAGIPKGSFYHYFQSKEQFGETLLQRYFDDYLARVESLFKSSDGNYYQNLMRFWQYWVENNRYLCESGQCLVVKLASEVSDLSEAMRQVMVNGTHQAIQLIAACIEKGKQAGDIQVNDSQALAEYLYEYWLGSCLMNKIRQDDVSLQRALARTEQLLKGNSTI